MMAAYGIREIGSAAKFLIKTLTKFTQGKDRYKMSSFTSEKAFRVGIVGATGAVGIEVIKCLKNLKFPVTSLHLYASKKSAGKLLSTEFGEIVIEEFTIEESRKCDVIFLAVSGDFALENVPKIIENNGPYVIDNSSAFRYTDSVPLVVSTISSLLFVY